MMISLELAEPGQNGESKPEKLPQRGIMGPVIEGDYDVTDGE
jgi:hypothetical protein